MTDRFAITVLSSRPMELHASLRHTLRTEGVVVSSTQHEHDAVPIFLGLLFRHGVDSKCFGVLRLPARISEQQRCTKIVIACREEFGPAGDHCLSVRLACLRCSCFAVLTLAFQSNSAVEGQTAYESRALDQNFEYRE